MRLLRTLSTILEELSAAGKRPMIVSNAARGPPLDLVVRQNLATAVSVNHQANQSVSVGREGRSRAVVLGDVGAKDSPQRPLVEDDDVVSALAPDRADDAFECPGIKSSLP